MAAGQDETAFLGTLVHTVMPADKAEAVVRELQAGNVATFLWELVQFCNVRCFGFGALSDLLVYLKTELAITEIDVPKVCLLTCERVSQGVFSLSIRSLSASLISSPYESRSLEVIEREEQAVAGRAT